MTHGPHLSPRAPSCSPGAATGSEVTHVPLEQPQGQGLGHAPVPPTPASTLPRGACPSPPGTALGLAAVGCGCQSGWGRHHVPDWLEQAPSALDPACKGGGSWARSSQDTHLVPFIPPEGNKIKHKLKLNREGRPAGCSRGRHRLVHPQPATQPTGSWEQAEGPFQERRRVEQTSGLSWQQCPALCCSPCPPGSQAQAGCLERGGDFKVPSCSREPARLGRDQECRKPLTRQ